VVVVVGVLQVRVVVGVGVVVAADCGGLERGLWFRAVEGGEELAVGGAEVDHDFVDV
jgi:hypothetical protein